jgi:hypothetical protein
MLSAVEAAHLAAWEPIGGEKTSLAFIRKIIRRTAYHEAAHTAARMFTGHEAAHVVMVSILPDAATDTLGRERMERAISEPYLASYPDQIKQACGRCLLLGMLAGRAAEARLDDSRDRFADEVTWRECESWEDEGTDFFRAARIAEIMARPGVPAHRVLRLAASWTVEMLDVPEVWETVEQLASVLIVRGEIADPDELFGACEAIRNMAFRLPKWRRRLRLRHDARRSSEVANRKAGAGSGRMRKRRSK